MGAPQLGRHLRVCVQHPGRGAAGARRAEWRLVRQLQLAGLSRWSCCVAAGHHGGRTHSGLEGGGGAVRQGVYHPRPLGN